MSLFHIFRNWQRILYVLIKVCGVLIVEISLIILSGVVSERIYRQQIRSAVFYARLVKFIVLCAINFQFAPI